MTSEGRDGAGTTALADPVRQRLVQIASDVLGRLDADEVPAALRPIHRFTAAKRVRLGAAALSASLDSDDRFRERVAEAVTEATPQLVDAIRAGEPTPATDPFDAAAVAYLVRPDGWAALVADVSGSWERQRAERAAAADEIAALRTELAELRARVKQQDTQLAEAVAAAESSTEATRLRNTLRIRTGELRTTERLLEAAHVERAEVQDRLELDLAAADTELGRLRTRIADLERAAEGARRESRTGRDVDDARLRLLLDTVTEAAAGIRRELALPAGTMRPADAVAASEANTGHGSVADPGALDRLLDLPRVHVIVDGYNVTKTGYPDLSLADQRTRLVSSMAALQARSGAEVTVVFDGGSRPPVQPPAPRGVRVLFSAADEIADDLIRQLVDAEPQGRVLLVVTADRAIVRDVHRAGAWTLPSAVLLQRLG